MKSNSSATGSPPAHLLFRTSGFYRPLAQEQYVDYASQVPDEFRFVIKAPSLVTDALVRRLSGQGREVNSTFLNPAEAVREPSERGSWPM